MNQINGCGERAAARYDLVYWTYNWRKGGGSQRMIEISKRENFYRSTAAASIRCDTTAIAARRSASISA